MQAKLNQDLLDKIRLQQATMLLDDELKDYNLKPNRRLGERRKYGRRNGNGGFTVKSQMTSKKYDTLEVSILVIISSAFLTISFLTFFA